MHELNRILDKDEKKKNCDKSCKDFLFDHRSVACCLSDVYSVPKNEPCAIHSDLRIKVEDITND